jgi:pseudaminic acid cytidylyltransferase
MSPRRLAIVPARGGSKRIPDKNIRKFGGRPMIAHILETAQRSKLFDQIHVSTESPRVAAVAESLGHKVDFLRPVTLSQDDTPLMPVLRYVVETYEAQARRFDEIWLLMPCSPMIELGDLEGAAMLYAQWRAQRAVLAVATYPVPIEWAYERGNDGQLCPRERGQFLVRSQDLGVKYYDAGTFAVFPAQRVIGSTGAGDDIGFVGYVLPRHKAIDIDTEEDWHFAEILFAGMKYHRTA